MTAKAGKENLITLSNAGVVAGGRTLVSGIDLTIARGEIVTLIGRASCRERVYRSV